MFTWIIYQIQHSSSTKPTIQFQPSKVQKHLKVSGSPETHTPEHLYLHELAVTAQQLAHVAQLVRAVYQGRRFNSSPKKT